MKESASFRRKDEDKEKKEGGKLNNKDWKIHNANVLKS